MRYTPFTCECSGHRCTDDWLYVWRTTIDKMIEIIIFIFNTTEEVVISDMCGEGMTQALID